MSGECPGCGAVGGQCYCDEVAVSDKCYPDCATYPNCLCNWPTRLLEKCKTQKARISLLERALRAAPDCKCHGNALGEWHSSECEEWRNLRAEALGEK